MMVQNKLYYFLSIDNTNMGSPSQENYDSGQSRQNCSVILTNIICILKTYNQNRFFLKNNHQIWAAAEPSVRGHEMFLFEDKTVSSYHRLNTNSLEHFLRAARPSLFCSSLYYCTALRAKTAQQRGNIVTIGQLQRNNIICFVFVWTACIRSDTIRTECEQRGWWRQYWGG